MRPEPIHILILLIVVLVIFGAPKLPMIAKNIGKSMKIFKSEVKDLRTDSDGQPEAEGQAREIEDSAGKPTGTEHIGEQRDTTKHDS